MFDFVHQRPGRLVGVTGRVLPGCSTVCGTGSLCSRSNLRLTSYLPANKVLIKNFWYFLKKMMHSWKRNFPMSPFIRRSVGRLVGRPVNRLVRQSVKTPQMGGKLHFPDPIGSSGG